MRYCYYINDPNVGRVLIPGCWGSVVGPYCTCPTRGSKKRQKDVEERLDNIEKRIYKLEASALEFDDLAPMRRKRA